jgi:hypothetical protein
VKGGVRGACNSVRGSVAAAAVAGSFALELTGARSESEVARRADRVFNLVSRRPYQTGDTYVPFFAGWASSLATICFTFS